MLVLVYVKLSVTVCYVLLGHTVIFLRHLKLRWSRQSSLKNLW